MGTRHLVVVKLNNKVKIAQYGQWDGYLTGQGHTIAEFLQSNNFNLKNFKKKVAALSWISDKENKSRWVECGADPDSDMVNMQVADKFKAKYPELSRDTGAEILNLVANGAITKLQNSYSFKKDGLFCEFCYVLNLDKKTVSIYTGGRKAKVVIPFKDFTKTQLDALDEKWNKD